MFHHLAYAVKNIAKSHYFYTEVMGFTLVAAVKRQAPGGCVSGGTALGASLEPRCVISIAGNYYGVPDGPLPRRRRAP